MGTILQTELNRIIIIIIIVVVIAVIIISPMHRLANQLCLNESKRGIYLSGTFIENGTIRGHHMPRWSTISRSNQQHHKYIIFAWRMREKTEWKNFRAISANLLITRPSRFEVHSRISPLKCVPSSWLILSPEHILGNLPHRSIILVCLSISWVLGLLANIFTSNGICILVFSQEPILYPIKNNFASWISKSGAFHAQKIML